MICDQSADSSCFTLSELNQYTSDQMQILKDQSAKLATWVWISLLNKPRIFLKQRNHVTKHQTSDNINLAWHSKSTFNLMESKLKGAWTKQQCKFQNYTQFLKSFHSWLQRSRVFFYNQKVCFYIFQKNKFSKGLSSNSGANINRFYGS